jgi:hypothetical protein
MEPRRAEDRSSGDATGSRAGGVRAGGEETGQQASGAWAAAEEDARRARWRWRNGVASGAWAAVAAVAVAKRGAGRWRPEGFGSATDTGRWISGMHDVLGRVD